MKIAVIPIDSRPVCYNLFSDIAALDDALELFLPPREMLGDLKKNADIDGIYNWLLTLDKMDAIVVSLDTIAYGGLIPSRRSEDSEFEILARLDKFKEFFENNCDKVLAFSSIMRISNNNFNEEEKDYWNIWGKKLFDYSYETHKNGCESCIASIIPPEILDDYMKTRARNFEINKKYLSWKFDTLVFAKDDCAEYGFNVQEARALESLGGFCKTGADEMPLALFARTVDAKFGVEPVFLSPKHRNLVSHYEDISIEDSVTSQIELAGLEIGYDMALYVNNFEYNQGEIVMGIPTKPYSGRFIPSKYLYMVCDVRYANGADNEFIKQLRNVPPFGFCAWNTSANSLGAVLCTSKVKFFAQIYNERAYKKLLTIRLLDDWAYQANVRQQITEVCDISELMRPYEEKVAMIVGERFRLKYSHPWNRLFEVEINVLD